MLQTVTVAVADDQRHRSSRNLTSDRRRPAGVESDVTRDIDAELRWSSCVFDGVTSAEIRSHIQRAEQRAVCNTKARRLEIIVVCGQQQLFH